MGNRHRGREAEGLHHEQGGRGYEASRVGQGTEHEWRAQRAGRDEVHGYEPGRQEGWRHEGSPGGYRGGSSAREMRGYGDPYGTSQTRGGEQDTYGHATPYGGYAAGPYREGERMPYSDGSPFYGQQRNQYYGQQSHDSGQSPGQGMYDRSQYAGGQYGPGQYGTGQHGTGQYGTGQYGTGQYGGGQHDSGQRGSGQYGSGYGGSGMTGQQGRGWEGSSWEAGRGQRGDLYARGGGYEGYGTADAGSSGGSSSMARGPHWGKGPKGYKRSDERIKEDVCERLAQQGHVDASDVEVRVQNGEITLSGTVSDRNDKRRIEELVENLSGVDDIKNEIRVRRETSSTSSTQGSQSSTTGIGISSATDDRMGRNNRASS